MAWWNPVSWFEKKRQEKLNPQETTTITTQAPQKLGVVVTDFTTGESVKTETRGDIIQRTYSPPPKSSGGGGHGGSSSISSVPQAIGEQEAIKQIEQNSPIASTKAIESSRSLLQQRLSKLNKETPLGNPDVQVQESTLHKIGEQASDVTGGIFSPTGAVWTEHFGRDTSVSAEEFKQDFKKTREASFGKDVPFWMPGIARILLFQYNSYQEARKLREAGEKTKEEQKVQLENIDKTIKDIEAKGEELNTELKSSGYEFDVDKFNQDVEKNVQESEKFTKDVTTFNEKYGGKTLKKSDYDIALKEKSILESQRVELTGEQQELEVRRKDLQTKQERLKSAYNEYESQTIKGIEDLRKMGIETKFNDRDELTFNSKALETEIKPIGWKVQETFKNKEGKVTWKNIAYGGASVVPGVAEGFVLGVATGGTGALAKVGTWIAKAPKIVKYGIYGTTAVLTIGGVTMKGVQGYKYAKSSNLPGWFGATIGSTQAIGEIGGFAYGGYVGTKAYYNRIENQILQGKYTKSIGETRSGNIVREDGKVKGGTAEQLGAYKTKVKGTKFEIRTDSRLKGVYGEDSGSSDIDVYSTFEGKTPKGFAKSYVTKGKSLETSDWIKARLYTKSTSGKNWYEQDILIKRALLGQSKVNVEGKAGFEGYKELEKLDIMAGIRTTGSPVKVGKTIPKDIFNEEEIFRFVNYKGQGKVMQPWEFNEAKPDSTSFTKQFVLYKETKPIMKTWFLDGKEIGQITADSMTQQEFNSIAKSGSLSDKLIKDLLKEKIFIFKDTSSGMLMNKGGKASPSLTWETPSTSLIPKSSLKVNPQIEIESIINQALKIQLKTFIPSLIAQQTSLAMPGAITTSLSLGGIKNIWASRQVVNPISETSLSLMKLEEIERVATLSNQKIMEVQQTKIAQTQGTKQNQLVQNITQVLNPPIVTTHVPMIPIIPMVELPLGWGGFQKQKKQPVTSRKSSTYIPDFTAKTLGIESKPMSQAQLKKLLKQTFTGFEVRPSLSWETPKAKRSKEIWK